MNKTTADLSAEQAAYWNGPGGEGWLAAYERIQRSLGEIGELVLAAAAPRPGEHVIDIGWRHRGHDDGAGPRRGTHRPCAGRRYLRDAGRCGALAPRRQRLLRRRRCRHPS